MANARGIQDPQRAIALGTPFLGTWTQHALPLYRLHRAISQLWRRYPPSFAFAFHYLKHNAFFGFFQNSG